MHVKKVMIFHGSQVGREGGGNKSENQFKSLNEVRKVNNAGEGHGKERKRKQAMNLGSPK